MPSSQLARLRETGYQERPDALSALRLATQWYQAGRRLEMNELASELGVSRTTLFRWVGGREELMGEILASLGLRTLRRIDRELGEAGTTGPPRVALLLQRFCEALLGVDYFRVYLQAEPERAMRVLTTKSGVVQARVVDFVQQVAGEEVDAGRLLLPLPVHEFAYLAVRIFESFMYADIIADDLPEPVMIGQALTLLLGAPDPTS